MGETANGNGDSGGRGVWESRNDRMVKEYGRKYYDK